MHPDYVKRPTSRLRSFDVILGRKVIDTVFYSPNDTVTTDEVYRSLVNHDGYDPRIVVRENR